MNQMLKMTQLYFFIFILNIKNNNIFQNIFFRSLREGLRDQNNYKELLTATTKHTEVQHGISILQTIAC